MTYQEWINSPLEEMVEQGPTSILVFLQDLPFGMIETDAEKRQKLASVYNVAAAAYLFKAVSNKESGLTDLESVMQIIEGLMPDESHDRTFVLGASYLLQTVLATHELQKEQNV